MTQQLHHEHLELSQNSPPDRSRRRLIVSMVGILPVVAGVLPAGYAWAANPQPAAPPVDKEQAERFMRRAIELAQQGVAAGDGGPFGTVIVKDGEIVGEGWNRVIATNDPTAHGEVVAIRDATNRSKSFSLAGCELYTTGEPCPMCLSAIYWANIERVFYGFDVQDAADVGFDDSFIYEQLAKPLSERKIPEAQVLGPEAVKMLKAYAADPNRVDYGLE